MGLTKAKLTQKQEVRSLALHIKVMTSCRVGIAQQLTKDFNFWDCVL